MPGVAAGIDYGFRLDGGDLLPDPRSLGSRSASTGLSRTYDHSAFALDGSPLARRRRCTGR